MSGIPLTRIRSSPDGCRPRAGYPNPTPQLAQPSWGVLRNPPARGRPTVPRTGHEPARRDRPLPPEALARRFDLLAADATEYALFLVDPDGRLLCWNPGAERLFGYRADEIIGQHFSRFFSPEDIINGQPEHELKTAPARRPTRTASAGRSARTAPGSGARPPSPPLLRRDTSRSRSFARVMHDLTDSQAQEAQTKRADGLAEANRSKEEFMALLSHELRNPLSPILNALGILRQMRTNDPVIQQAGNIIDRQVGQMVRLVDDLLDISRITKGKLRLTKEQVELRVVVNRAAESARPLMDARQHEFSVSLPTEPLWVEADPARLEQVRRQPAQQRGQVHRHRRAGSA